MSSSRLIFLFIVMCYIFIKKKERERIPCRPDKHAFWCLISGCAEQAPECGQAGGCSGLLSDGPAQKEVTEVSAAEKGLSQGGAFFIPVSEFWDGSRTGETPEDSHTSTV